MKLAKNAGRHSAVEALLLATLGDHAQVRHRHMSMFGRILVDSVFFCLRLGVFLHAMHFGMGHHAGNRNCMTDMIAEVDGIALDFPSRAFGGSELVLFGVIAFLQTALECACVFMSRFCCVLRPSQSGGASKQDQHKSCHPYLYFHSDLRKFRLKNDKTASVAS